MRHSALATVFFARASTQGRGLDFGAVAAAQFNDDRKSETTCRAVWSSATGIRRTRHRRVVNSTWAGAKAATMSVGVS